jgi:hypothetical protein
MPKRIVLAVAILVAIPGWGAMAQTDAERRACSPDAQSICPDEMPDRDRVYACLVRHVESLNPACKQIIRNSIAASRRRHFPHSGADAR